MLEEKPNESNISMLQAKGAYRASQWVPGWSLWSVFKIRPQRRISRVKSGSSSRANTPSQRTLSTSLETKHSISPAWSPLPPLIVRGQRWIGQTRFWQTFDRAGPPWYFRLLQRQMTPPGALINWQTWIVDRTFLVRLDRQWFWFRITCIHWHTRMV